MNNTKKVIIGIVFILAIYTAIMIFTFKNNESNNDKSVYLILDNSKNYEYNNGKFKSISNSEIEDLNKKYKVFIDNYLKGEYLLKFGNVWNLFDKKMNYTSYDGEFIAISDTSEIFIDNGNVRMLDESEKKLLLNEYKIKKFDNIYEKVYELDLNNDDKIDKIICVSNYDSENYNNNFNLVVAFIGNKKYNIINEKKKNNIYYLDTILNIKNQSSKILAIRKITNPDGDVESNKEEYNIYRFNGKSYKKI